MIYVNIRMFSLNSIGCVTRGPAGILEGNTTDEDMVMNVKSSVQKDLK